MTEAHSKIVYFTRFTPVVAAGGGCRRFVQILESCPHIDWQLVSSHEVSLPRSSRTIFDFLGGSSISLRAWNLEHSPYAIGLWKKATYWAKKFQFPPQCQIALVDDPIYFEPLLCRLKREGIKVVGICHNLESLSGTQVAEGRQQKLLNHELRVLSECDLVVTISREETFLLENLGIKTFFFPYFPAKSIYHRLEKIRSVRAGALKKNILMMGTANNKATKHGMIRAIQDWQKLGLGASGCELLLAGYGTEFLAAYSGKGTRFLGPLSDEDLDRLLPTVKACLCYQEQASGALTRIPEMLTAGIPVLANPLAARSYYNLKGVIEFLSFSHLGEALRAIDYLVEIPIPSPPASQDLESAICELIN